MTIGISWGYMGRVWAAHESVTQPGHAETLRAWLRVPVRVRLRCSALLGLPFGLSPEPAENRRVTRGWLLRGALLQTSGQLETDRKLSTARSRS